MDKTIGCVSCKHENYCRIRKTSVSRPLFEGKLEVKYITKPTNCSEYVEKSS